MVIKNIGLWKFVIVMLAVLADRSKLSPYDDSKSQYNAQGATA
jgi:hypothetical protein